MHFLLSQTFSQLNLISSEWDETHGALHVEVLCDLPKVLEADDPVAVGVGLRDDALSDLVDLFLAETN